MSTAIQTTRGTLTPFEIQRYRNIVKSAIVLIVLWRLGRPSGSSEIAKILDINRETVASHLESLGLIGLVTRTDMRGGYRLTDDGQQLMLQVPGGYLLDETIANAFGSQPHELTLHKNEAGSTTQALPEPGMVIDVSENPTFTQGENTRMSEFPTFNVGNSDIQTLKKKKEEINLKDSDSSTSFLRASNVGNSDIQVSARVLVENSEILFEPQAVIMRGLDLEALDTGLVLGWLAQAYSERGNLANPAGLVYARLRSTDCPRPRRKYLDEPYRYLPRAYLDAVGLQVDDALRLDERRPPSAFDMGAIDEDNEPAHPQEEHSDSLKSAWSLVMEKLRNEVAPSSLATWAGDTKIRSYDGETVTVTARNDYACQWLRQHVAGSALAVLTDTLGAANLVFVPE